MSSFIIDIRWAVYADILLSYNNLSLFPRNKDPKYLLKFEPDGKPTIDRSKILNLLKRVQRRKRRRIVFGKTITYSPSIDCYGHLLSTYFLRSLSYLLKKHSIPTELPKYYAHSLAIDQFVNSLVDSTQLNYYTHYQTQLDSLP